MCPFDYTAFVVSGKVGIWFNHSSLLAIQTDRPKSVLNRFVSEGFGGVCVLSRCFFWVYSVGVGAFVIGLGQISPFFSYRSFT